MNRLSLLALLLCTAPAAFAATPPRQRLRMDANWRFHRGEVPQPGMPAEATITNWRWRSATGDADTVPTGDMSGVDWKDATIGNDVFGGRRGFAWYRATVPGVHVADTKTLPVLHFESVDDNATVYLNGQKLIHHEGWNDAFDVPLGAAWKQDGPNDLAVLVENTDRAGGIAKPVTLLTAAPPPPLPAAATFDDRAWRTVHLPHDYVVEGTFDPKADLSHGFLPADTGWYRKTFHLPRSMRGKSVWIDFDGVFSDAKVWLNGQYLGENRSGYIGGRFDIGNVARCGAANVLALHTDARKFEGWWYEGGGIYRHVWLNVADPVHVAPWGTFVTSQVHGLEAGQTPSATLMIKTTLVNALPTAQHCVVTWRVLAPDGTRVEVTSSQPTVGPQKTAESTVQMGLNAPARLWSVETPRLYQLVTTVQRDGRVVDTTTTPFGIRTIRFDADKGFFLNGKPVKLKGTCNHQDHAGVGVAMPDSLLVWRIRKLKEMGANAYRCSHNPVAPELLDACDRLGMLVMDETRHLGDTYSGKTSPGTPASDLGDLSKMVMRDRNHPSIIMWSMCNEEPLQGSPDGARIGRAMKQRINELDGSRPVTAAQNGGHGEPGLSTVVDMEGFNYSPSAYDGFHRAHPTQPMYGSETASTVSTRGIYANDREKGYVSAYDVNFPGWAQTAENAWQPIAERDFVAGGFVWTGFDYKGEPTPYGWPCINSHFGIIDICGFPKDNFYYYQAWWGNKPLVHILPHWNWTGQEGKEISVWCHSNCDQVELFLNGQSLGVKDMPRYRHVEWKVPYAAGTLEARGITAGKVTATDRVTTTGPAAALELKPEQTSIMADGEDLALVPVSARDAAGRIVPTADNEVTFEVTGPATIAGVGNGDPSSHEPDKASQRRAFNGLALVLVQATGRPGRITVTARAAGLRPATVTILSVASAVKDVE